MAATKDPFLPQHLLLKQVLFLSSPGRVIKKPGPLPSMRSSLSGTPPHNEAQPGWDPPTQVRPHAALVTLSTDQTPLQSNVSSHEIFKEKSQETPNVVRIEHVLRGVGGPGTESEGHSVMSDSLQPHRL